MNIKPLYIETVFSGFIHLVWITLLTLCALDLSPVIIINFLEEVGSGTAVFLIAVIFSISFFLGRMAEHFIIALNYFIHKDRRPKYVDTFGGTHGEIWGNKIFALSSCLGLLVLVAILIIVTGFWKILFIGAILIAATFISFIYWYNFEKRKYPN